MGMRWTVDPDRPLECYGRAAWVARTVARNAAWSRTQGVRQLAEEHDLQPVRRTARAMRRVRWQLAHRGENDGAEPVAVFVGGVGRSGTNMLMRALAASPEIETYNEGSRKAFVRYRLRSDREIWQLVDSSGRRAVAFKPLLDSHRIADLLAARPETVRVLWPVRNVDAVTRSHVLKFGSQPRDALRRVADGSGDALWHSKGLSDADRAELKMLEWSTATPEDGAALLWLLRNRLYFRHGLCDSPCVRLTCYEALVANPVAILRDVVEFLGLSWYPFMASGIGRRSANPGVPVQLSPFVRSLCSDLTSDLREAWERRP